jgi:hypothetical protein
VHLGSGGGIRTRPITEAASGVRATASGSIIPLSPWVILNKLSTLAYRTLLTDEPLPFFHGSVRYALWGIAVKARRLIESSDFSPETLHIIYEAFDAAWAEICHHFADDESGTEHARLRLAHAVLVVASEGSNDAGRPQERCFASDGARLP